MATQLELKNEILEATNINIVTCGNCGNVVLHKLNATEIECTNCGYKSEPCDFPDLNIK